LHKATQALALLAFVS